jgi:hypothetical protein
MYWRVLSLLCIVLAACSDLQRPEQLERIEAMENRLETARESLDAISDSLLFSVYKFGEDMKMKMELYAPDTLSLKDALRLDRYGMAGKSSLFVLDERYKLQTLLPQYDEDLRKLKQDIESGSGQRHRYEEFLRFEEEKVEAFFARTEACERQAQKVMDVNDELRAVLEAELNERMSEVSVQRIERQ